MVKVIRKGDKAYLTKKNKKSVLSFIFSNVGFITFVLVVQALFFWQVYRNFLNYVPQLFTVLVVVDVITCLNIMQDDSNSDLKLTWTTAVFLLPFLGAAVYYYIRYDILNSKIRKRFVENVKTTNTKLQADPMVLEEIKDKKEVIGLHNYLSTKGINGVYTNCETVYFPCGEKQFEVMKDKLRKAKSFIFMEYFIIEEGDMWGEILNILLDKVAHGVDVKIIYDGTCDFEKLPRNYFKKLNELGIQTQKFMPFYPIISVYYNFRDHRKMTIIDGEYAFVGGTNIADEYINHSHPYGYWKDTCLMIRGKAVDSYTLMFLQMFNYRREITDYSYIHSSKDSIFGNMGVVIPYGDGPVNTFLVAETVYLDIINNARDYCYIITPYLVTDSTIESALKLAASKGVDVRIILPGRADKISVNLLAKSRYKQFINDGIKIYEYDYGFVHAKQMVSDGIRAAIGTVNLDYRSLYHHFECGTYLYETDSVQDIENDFIKTLGYCHRVDEFDLKKYDTRKNRIIVSILKLFEPLI